MTLMVTGGAGFIGSNFLYFMAEHDPQLRLVCLDKLTYAGNLQTIKPLLGLERFRFVRADISDGAAVASLLAEERPDAVINFAAETHVDRSIDGPGAFVQTNIVGTSVLLEACRQAGVRRFHQVSTDEVYGDLPLDRPDLLFTEDSPLRASSPYAASKAAADLLTLSYGRTYGMHVTVSRCSNNYGPYQFPEKLIPRMILRALADKPLPVYGEGLNVRDWLDVADHCRALALILLHGAPGEVYNVGGHNERRNIDIVRMICRALGKPETLIAHVADRQGHDRRYAIDPSKMERLLGWRSQTTFEDGLDKTIRWYVENRAWWSAIENGEYCRVGEAVF